MGANRMPINEDLVLGVCVFEGKEIYNLKKENVESEFGIILDSSKNYIVKICREVNDRCERHDEGLRGRLLIFSIFSFSLTLNAAMSLRL